jgi:fatty acyl-CoA reductase
VEERVYEISPENPEQLIDAVGWMSEEMLKVVTPILLRSRPNTYTFAKAVAENVLVKEASNLPLIIVRPSIIGSTWREPLPGWTDNMNGPTGIFVGVSLRPDHQITLAQE